ncbi:MAG: hypothetical protein ABFS14_06660, partial [Gemmatimonadota bacterium]
TKEEGSFMKPTLIAAVILAAIAVVHLFRLVLGWDFIVGTLAIPMWPSVVVVLVFGGLSAALCRQGRT